MAMEIRLPALGENIDSATVTRIMVKVGQSVNKDQPILELDTEKTSVDVPASSAGTVQEIRVKEGDVIRVGQVVLTLADGVEKPAPAASSEQKNQKVEKDAKVEKAQRAEMPAAPPSSQAPTEQNLTVESRQQTDAPAPPPPSSPVQSPAASVEEDIPEKGTDTVQKGAPAAPSLRRMARELGIDINAVVGTGPNGWITKEDVRNFARSIILNATTVETGRRSLAPSDFSRWGPVERKAISSVRRTIAEHLHSAWTSIPHVTLFATADITELENFRESVVARTPSGQPKLTVTAIAVKVLSAALKVFPQFNTSLDLDREELVFKHYCHIGIAVDTEHGLLVPVIRDVDKKSISDLSVEMAALAEKARNRKLSIEEMQGGTFTVTNLGGIGATNFTPIINSPEVAILGISRASLHPVFRDGEFKPRLTLPLALSFDHRVADGADAARFLRWVAEALEQPIKLVL
jgi:pyruvate dehydrogenase E2 component (dihydrolipoamide acetyltransferase)